MIPKNNFLFGIYGKKPLFKPFLHDSQPVFYLGFMGKRTMNPMSPINSVSASMNPMKSEAGIYAETHCLCGFSPCVPNNLLCVGRLIINPKGSLWQEKNIYTNLMSNTWLNDSAPKQVFKDCDLQLLMFEIIFFKRLIYFVIHGKIIYKY